MAPTTLDNPIILGLPDVCADVFALLVQLRYESPAADADGLRRMVGDLFRDVDRKGSAHGIGRSEMDDVRFALAATLDELVLTSEWPLRDEWASRPLALELFDDANAGETFYTRLQNIARGAPGHRAELVEVYLTCLHLGFRGQYADYDGLEKLKAVVAENTRLVLGDAPAAGALSPHAQPASSLQQSLRRWPVWAWVAIGLGAVVLLSLVLSGCNASSAGSVRDQAEKITLGVGK